MNNIHTRICSRLGLWLLFVFIFVLEKNICYTPKSPDIVKNKARRSISSNIEPNHQYGKLQNGFDIYIYHQYGKLQKGFDIYIIFRLVGSSNLGFDYFQIFKYIQIFEYIREYFLRIIFLFIFVTQGVKNNIHICICPICLLQIIFIFVFVHQKIYSLHCMSDSIDFIIPRRHSLSNFFGWRPYIKYNKIYFCYLSHN